jgi:hypothetical protein
MGLIVARLGVLDNDLGKVLREPQVLSKAISEALARSDAKYAIADRFDEAKGEYVGLKLAQLDRRKVPSGGSGSAAGKEAAIHRPLHGRRDADRRVGFVEEL